MEDDEEEYDENRLQQLYERFKQDLAQHTAETYYDVDDLVDIFDFAGDMRDEYVRLEALMMANRLFPDDEEVEKRHAIYLANISNEALAAFLASLPQPPAEDDAMWAILRARVNPDSRRHPVAVLESIIERFDLEDDETEIQFVNLVRALQQEDWLAENLDKVRKHCSYEATLLFEISRLAETNTQVERSITLMEELTMIDPFNTDYWGLLAELQSNTGRFNEALTSLDYAKAIAPDDAEMLALEGYVNQKLGNDAKAAEVYEMALKADPNYYMAQRNLLDCYVSAQRFDEAAGLAEALFDQDPADEALLTYVLRLMPDRHAEWLSRHYAEAAPEEDVALRRASELCQSGAPKAALHSLEWYAENFSLSQTGVFTLIEIYYLNELYEKAYVYMIKNLDHPVLQPHQLPAIAIIASLLLRLRRYGETKEFCEQWIQRIEETGVPKSPYYLMMRGVYDTLMDISHLLTKKKITDENINDVAV